GGHCVLPSGGMLKDARRVGSVMLTSGAGRTHRPRACCPVSAGVARCTALAYESAHRNKCADDAKNGSAKRAKIVIWTCSSADRAQRWTFTHGEFRHNGLCLNAKGNAANGSKVILWTCNGSAGEIWALQKNNTVALKAHGWKLCLTDPND